MEDSTKPAVPPASRCCNGLFFLDGDDEDDFVELLAACAGVLGDL